MTAVLNASTDLQEQARAAFRDSVAAGAPLSRQALGERFGKSASWGRDRIAEVRAEDDNPGDTATDTATPAVVEQWDLVPAEHAPVSSVPDVAPPVVTVAPEVTVTPDTGTDTRGTPQPRGARAVAWFAFVFGIAVSIAANVGHAYYPSPAQLETWRQLGGTGQWQPEPGAVVGAGFWPLALLLAVEVLCRVRWVSGLWWNLARFGGTGLVAVVAAVLSYRHMAALLLAYGEDSLNAHLGPLAVDGLMVVSGFALLTMGMNRKA